LDKWGQLLTDLAIGNLGKITSVPKGIVTEKGGN
jgi:hypothetical protein